MAAPHGNPIVSVERDLLSRPRLLITLLTPLRLLAGLLLDYRLPLPAVCASR